MPKTLKTLTVENAEQSTSGGWYKISNICSKLACYMQMEMYKLHSMQMLHFVLKPGKPVLYVGITTDVQRDYFKPIFDNAFKSIK